MGVQKGDLVTVDYVGTFDDGKVFDTSMEWIAAKAGVKNPKRLYEPMEFRVGSGEMIPGFEDAVIDMEVDQVKKIAIPAEKAYGPSDPKKVKTFQLAQFKRSGIEPKIGQQFSINKEPGTVTRITASEVEVDFNHPMAGKTLHFEITVRKILRNPEKVQI
jgi:FKBP-type peptidyl-prolyl cis-trans isomerase 2